LLGEALNYTDRLWPKLTAYREDGRYQISNERAKNAIRPFATARKNVLFFDSPLGAKADENYYSLIITAKSNGLTPFYYLADIFKVLPAATTLEDIEALLPWNVNNDILKASVDLCKGRVLFALTDKSLETSCKRIFRVLVLEIKRIEKRLAKHVEEQAEWTEKQALLKTAPGVGDTLVYNPAR